MKKSCDAFLLTLCLAVGAVVVQLPSWMLAERVSPAIVLKNDVRKAVPDVVARKSVSPTSTGHVRTTTVYGFLDFTTTIDNTVVVFRPSSASPAPTKSTSTTSASASSSSSSSSSAASSSSSDVKSTTEDRRINVRATKTPARQMSTGTVTSDRRGAAADDDDDDNNGRPGRMRAAGPAVVMLGRADPFAQRTTPTISPTPTIRRSTSASSSPPSSSAASGRRLVNNSSLSEKRRRFLALARRHRPTIKPKGAAAADDDGGNDDNHDQTTQAESSDQVMAESIERTPNKVKRMYNQPLPSSNYSSPQIGNGGRILIRKLQRRLGGGGVGGGSTRSDKNRQALAFRRPSSKLNLLTGSGGNADDDDDDDEFDDKEDLDQRSFLPVKNGPILLVSSFDSGLVASNGPASGAGSDVTEYHELYHDVTEYLGSDSKATVLQSSLMSPSNGGGGGDYDRSSMDEPASTAALVGTTTTTTTTTSDQKQRKSSARTGPTVPLQLSIVTSSYSTTETRLRTSLLPVYDGKSTTFYTLTHSFVVTKTVSTFQTVPPEEYMHYLIPGNHSNDESTLDAFNDILESDRRPSSSSLVLQRKVDDLDNDDQLEDDEDNDQETATDELLEKSGSIHTDVDAANEKANEPTTGANVPPTQAALGQVGNPGAVNPALLGNLPFYNLLGPAAALGLNPYFPYGLGIPQVLTTSRPIFSTDVIYTSKLVPIIDGLTTAYRTLQEAASTVTRTSYETYVTTTGNAPGNVGGLMGGPAGLPGSGGGGGGGVSIITQPHTFVTTETQVETQVFKLMYDGYKTSYRTVSSSQLITRTVTTHTTTTVPVYNTLQLPFFG